MLNTVQTLLVITIIPQIFLFVVLGLYETKDLTVGVDFFCESVNNQSLFVQQANAWSAVSYIVVAWSCTLFVAGRSTNLHPYQYLAPFLISCVGVGSIAFHGLVHLWGGIVDFIALILYLSFELAMSLPNQTKSCRILIWLSLAILILFLVYYTPPSKYDDHYGVYLPSDIGTPSLIVVTCLISVFVVLNLIEFWRSPNRRYALLLLAAIWLIAGFAFWISFQDGCEPEREGIHGHAAWHVLTSFAMGTIFLFRELQ